MPPPGFDQDAGFILLRAAGEIAVGDQIFLIRIVFANEGDAQRRLDLGSVNPAGLASC